MKSKLIHIALLCLMPLVSKAQMLSQKDIKTLAKYANDNSDGSYSCHAEGRTMIYETWLYDKSYIAENTKEKILARLESTVVNTCVANNISIRYTFHYYDEFYRERTYNVTLSPIDLLDLDNLDNYYHTKTNPKADGVNMVVPSPLYWERKDANNPHVVQKFQAGTLHYLIQINPFVTFVSKREAKEMFDGQNEGLGFDLDEMKREITMSALDVNFTNTYSTFIGNYPALKLEYTSAYVQQDIRVDMYANAWVLFYEDYMIQIICIAATNNPDDYLYFSRLFTVITNHIRFPDQYNDLNYE